jgi:hypothetical protein
MRVAMHTTVTVVKSITAVDDDLVQYNSMRYSEQRAVIIDDPIVICCCGR